MTSPALLARFAAACHAAGLPVGPDRAVRLARAVVAVRPQTTARLRACAQATLVADPAELPLLDRVFDAVFGAASSPPSTTPSAATRRAARTTRPSPPATTGRRADAGPAPGGALQTGDRGPRGPASDARRTGVPVLGSPAERLADRDFADVERRTSWRCSTPSCGGCGSPPRCAAPAGPGRAPHGAHVDLRRTLSAARRTGGHPIVLARRTRRMRPRRLVVLCDISGSMEAYARAMLQLLYCAAGGDRAEVFTFATRLTRLTRALARSTPAQALERAGRLAPDWSGGTRIGLAVAQLLDRHGGGLVRGAVVLVVSDGWDTGDPAELGRQMARLHRLAHRVVWANPRTAARRLPPPRRRHGGGVAALRRGRQRPQPAGAGRPAGRPGRGRPHDRLVPSAAVQLVLASASPARLSVLRAAGLDPRSRSPTSTRTRCSAACPTRRPAAAVTALAGAKATAVARRVAERLPDAVVVGCDSMLHIDGALRRQARRRRHGPRALAGDGGPDRRAA